MTVSIIIPTLNEESYLPGLLDAIRRQTWPPLEIIIADAGSSDQTVEIAREAGCRVVPGGRPARGRNAGAAIAQGDVFLFLDADVLPAPGFLARALPEFNARRLAAATCPLQPFDGDTVDALLHGAANWYLRALRPISPRAPGCCLFSPRWAHEAIGGFDESLWLAEDHDYVRRLVAYGGRFGILHTPIPVSVRRLESDGRWNVAARYTLSELNYLVSGNLYQPFFDFCFGEYRFGQHGLTSASPKHLPIELLWRQITPVFSPFRQAVGAVHRYTSEATGNLRAPVWINRRVIEPVRRRWRQTEEEHG